MRIKTSKWNLNFHEEKYEKQREAKNDRFETKIANRVERKQKAFSTKSRTNANEDIKRN